MALKLLLLIFCTFISFLLTHGLILVPMDLFPQHFDGILSFDPVDIEMASLDFGGVTRMKPLAVLYPGSANDVVTLIRFAYNSTTRESILTVSAKGHGHSFTGQAQTANGVVIDMSDTKGSNIRKCRLGLPYISVENPSHSYVDVWGGDLWIDVLNCTLKHGVAPKSWTDVLDLTVGGTLSNAGISGQTFNHGPQISNVFELDVVTGKGELITCSKQHNSELFHGVLGGLGQFGIITRARIALERAPQRVKWIRAVYSDFKSFTKDQEFLISLHGQPPSQKFDYIEGRVAVEEEFANGGRLYSIEIAKNYDESSADTMDLEVDALLNNLDFIPSSLSIVDLPYEDFIDRFNRKGQKHGAEGPREVGHPWLNLFVPKSRIGDFDKAVFKGILANNTSGLLLLYPANKIKWDDETSVVTPDEDVFYVVGLLRTALDPILGDEMQTWEYLSHQNQQILKYCVQAGIKVKTYLQRHNTQDEWRVHFGEKWDLFFKRKMEFDPKYILATGQRIFLPKK